jgi:endonuclease YncB( thermonuclease family)
MFRGPERAVAAVRRGAIIAALSMVMGLWLVAVPGAFAQEPKPAPARAVRDVTPAGTVRVFRSESTIVEAKSPLPDGAKRIAGALVRRDGTIIGEGVAIRLYGIAEIDPDRICTSALGERWACGRRAYLAFYNRVKEQEVACKMLDDGAGTCWADQDELSAWLLGNGLAELAPGVAEPRLKAAAEAARNAKLGIWSDRPTDLRR